MAIQLPSIATQPEAPAGFIRQPDACSCASREPMKPSGCPLPAILMEQLIYLTEYADQEQDRLERVKAVLLETFN
jgi:hypothetical protein